MMMSDNEFNSLIDQVWKRTRYCRNGYYYVKKATLEETSPCYYTVGVDLYGEKFNNLSDAKKYFNDIKVIEKARDGDVIGKAIYYWPSDCDTLELIARKIYHGSKRERVEDWL